MGGGFPLVNPAAMPLPGRVIAQLKVSYYRYSVVDRIGIEWLSHASMLRIAEPHLGAPSESHERGYVFPRTQHPTSLRGCGGY